MNAFNTMIMEDLDNASGALSWAIERLNASGWQADESLEENAEHVLWMAMTIVEAFEGNYELLRDYVLASDDAPIAFEKLDELKRKGVKIDD